LTSNEFNQEGQKGHKIIQAGTLGEESIGLILVLPRGACFESVDSVQLGHASNLVWCLISAKVRVDVSNKASTKK
jgi:hypothetical protein